MRNLKTDSLDPNKLGRVVIIIKNAPTFQQGSRPRQYLQVHGTKRPYIQALKQKFYLDQLEQIEDHKYMMSNDREMVMSQFVIDNN